MVWLSLCLTSLQYLQSVALRAASVGSNDEINFSPMGQGLGGSGSPRGSLSVATSLPDSVDLDNLVSREASHGTGCCQHA